MPASASVSAASGPSYNPTQNASQAPSTTKSKSKAPSQISNLSSTLPHTSNPSPESLRQISEARLALTSQINSIGSSLTTQIQSRAQTLHSNSAQLEKQEKDVQTATEVLRKEGDKLKKVAQQGSRTIKELGDVQNWAEVMERDFLVLEETLRLARGDSSGSESYSDWSGSEKGDEREEEMGVENGVEDRVGGEEAMMVYREEEATESQNAIDVDGDFSMSGIENPSDTYKDKGKGKVDDADEISLAQSNTEIHPDVVGGSSTATNESASIPSSSSIHTTSSVVVELGEREAAVLREALEE